SRALSPVVHATRPSMAAAISTMPRIRASRTACSPIEDVDQSATALSAAKTAGHSTVVLCLFERDCCAPRAVASEGRAAGRGAHTRGAGPDGDGAGEGRHDKQRY